MSEKKKGFSIGDNVKLAPKLTSILDRLANEGRFSRKAGFNYMSALDTAEEAATIRLSYPTLGGEVTELTPEKDLIWVTVKLKPWGVFKGKQLCLPAEFWEKID